MPFDCLHRAVLLAELLALLARGAVLLARGAVLLVIRPGRTPGYNNTMKAREKFTHRDNTAYRVSRCFRLTFFSCHKLQHRTTATTDHGLRRPTIRPPIRPRKPPPMPSLRRRQRCGHRYGHRRYGHRCHRLFRRHNMAILPPMPSAPSSALRPAIRLPTPTTVRPIETAADA